MPTVFCILPLIALLVFYTRLCKCFHRYKLVCEVVKVFQKHFKDGSAGTRDYRFFSGFYFAFRIFYFLNQYLGLQYEFYARWFLCFLATIFISYLHPYKAKKYNRLDSFWFAKLTVITVAIQYQATVGDSNITGFAFGLGNLMPCLYIIILAIYAIVKTTNSQCCQKRCPMVCCNHCIKNNSAAPIEDQLPDRIINSLEYRPLLQK